MGDPKISRRKFDRPSHPWQGERIQLENELLKKYGLKSKKELWRIQSLLKNCRQQSRDLMARMRMDDPQAKKEMDQLLLRLANLGILSRDAGLDDVLALTADDFLARRLQTQIYLKGLANTPKQARQFIVHGHISVSGRKTTIPGYLVLKTEEDLIDYNEYSPISHELHPVRPKPEGYVEPGAPKKEEGTAPAENEGAPKAPSEGEPKTEPKPTKDAVKEVPKEDKKRSLGEEKSEAPKEDKKEELVKEEPLKEEPKEGPKNEEKKKEPIEEKKEAPVEEDKPKEEPPKEGEKAAEESKKEEAAEEKEGGDK